MSMLTDHHSLQFWAPGSYKPQSIADSFDLAVAVKDMILMYVLVILIELLMRIASDRILLRPHDHRHGLQEHERIRMGRHQLDV